MNGMSNSRSFTRKAFATALAGSLALSVALPASVAEAGQRGYYKGSHSHAGSHHKRPRHGHGGDTRRIEGGELLAAGIIGLAVGAIIADAARPRVVYETRPAPVYVPPQPVYRQPLDTYTPYHGDTSYRGEPRVIRYEDEIGGGHGGGYATYEPWTPEWADWCDAKYRSFNPSTGTFRGYDGRDHFCVVK